MEVTARTIADHLSGEIIGDPNVKVSSVAKIEQGRPGTLCFLANPKYEPFLYTCKASIVLINNSFTPKEEVSATLIKVDNAYEAVASLLELLNTLKASRKKTSLFPRYRRALSSKIGKGTYIGEYSYIGKKTVVGKYCQIYPQVFLGDNVTLGDNVIIYPGAKVYNGCIIGNNCIIHSNTVIGSDGFGFAPLADGTYKKIPQTGNVILEDNVEIGSNSAIDRATIGSTIIKSGVKIDNLVQVAHNAIIGENTVLAAQTGIAGTAKIGKNCQFGGQTGVAGHLEVADRTIVTAQTGLAKSVKKEGTILSGSPAEERMEHLRSLATLRRLSKGDRTK